MRLSKVAVIFVLLTIAANTVGFDMMSILPSVCTFFNYECCMPTFARAENGLKYLKKKMKDELFGQHLAFELILSILDGHFSDNDLESRNLCLSFHGWTGTGKSFLSKLITSSFFEKGSSSRFLHIFESTKDFYNPEKIHEYKENIISTVEDLASKCPFSIIVFDEADKAPPGLFDVLSHYIEKVQNTKMIFIFLSNTGSPVISEITYQHWKEGKKRSDLTLKHFDNALRKSIFQAQGSGLFQSSLIDRSLIDFFIPFLPLEAEHVHKCIETSFKRLNVKATENDISKVMSHLKFWPENEKIYSVSGCKRVEQLAKLQKSRKNSRLQLDRSDL